MSMHETADEIPISTKDRHTVVPASYLMLRRGDEVLLARRCNTGYEDGKYGVPAGHVERGETFTEALIREVSEEVGLCLDPESIRVAHIMHRKSYGSERIDTFFVAERWEGEAKNMEPHKCDDLAWFSVDDLPENTIAYVRHALDRIRAGEFYSEFGFVSEADA